VNALSEELDLESGATVSPGATYSKGEPTSNSRSGSQQEARHPRPLHSRQDDFTATEYNFDTLSQRLRELAF